MLSLTKPLLLQGRAPSTGSHGWVSRICDSSPTGISNLRNPQEDTGLPPWLVPPLVPSLTCRNDQWYKYFSGHLWLADHFTSLHILLVCFWIAFCRKASGPWPASYVSASFILPPLYWAWVPSALHMWEAQCAAGGWRAHHLHQPDFFQKNPSKNIQFLLPICQVIEINCSADALKMVWP